MRKFLRVALLGGVAVVGFVFLAAFVSVLLGDPEFGPAPPMTAEAMATLAARFEQPYAAESRRFPMRDGVSLNAQCFPAASDTTIVIVHGVLESSYPLNRTSGLLRQAGPASVVAIDLRGHGASGGAPGDVRYIGQYEDDLADVIAKIRSAKPGGRVILAGHSMGGGIALRYAMKKGPPVDGYLLLAPHLGATSPTTPTEATSSSASFVQIHLPRLLGLVVFNSVGVTGFNGLQTLFFNLPKELPLRSYTYRALAGMAPEDRVPALRAIHQPLLVVVGSKDEAFRAEKYEAAIRPYSHGQVVILEGATHDGILNDGRTFAAVTRWLHAS